MTEKSVFLGVDSPPRAPLRPAPPAVLHDKAERLVRQGESEAARGAWALAETSFRLALSFEPASVTVAHRLQEVVARREAERRANPPKLR